jgi:hypothetical protein
MGRRKGVRKMRIDAGYCERCQRELELPECRCQKAPPPVNPAAHEFLTANGYTHQYYPPDYDDGDPENGPGTWGCPGYDLYTSEEDEVYIDEYTKEAMVQARDKDLEDWLATNVP